LITGITTTIYYLFFCDIKDFSNKKDLQYYDVSRFFTRE
jgi:hypothetical protein